MNKLILLFTLCFLCSNSFAETRNIAYTSKQLLEMSTLAFEGTVIKVETVAEYAKSFPIKATVGKMLKGKTDDREISMRYKHPGKYTIFEAEYNTPEENQKGTFYITTKQDGNFTLIGYQIIAEDHKNIEGVWEKYYFEQNGQKNYDHRWKLKVSFSNTSEFIWDTTFLQEEWLVNTKTEERSTQVITHKNKLEGKYIFRDEKYHIVLDHPLSNEEKEKAINNLGYNETSGECAAEIYFEKELLAIKEPNSDGTVFFKKMEKTSNEYIHRTFPLREKAGDHCVIDK